MKLLLALMFSTSVMASSTGFELLSPKEIRNLLGDYPALGTPVSNADFSILLSYQETRSHADCEEARAEESSTLEKMFAGPRGPLSRAEAKKLFLAALPLYAEAGANILRAKNLYKRPRPYLVNLELKPCIDLESSYAYPSGHTALARAFAHFLSARFPDRRSAFFDRAEEVAENRILGGVHHPSDIVAGKKLGDRLARRIQKSEKFRKFLTTDI